MISLLFRFGSSNKPTPPNNLSGNTSKSSKYSPSMTSHGGQTSDFASKTPQKGRLHPTGDSTAFTTSPPVLKVLDNKSIANLTHSGAINEPFLGSRTPLFYAVASFDSKNTKRLLQNGADPNIPD